MSTLLRHPGAVPSLFSERDPEAARRPSVWRRLAPDPRLLTLAALAGAMLVDVPLVRAATAAVDLMRPS